MTSTPEHAQNPYDGPLKQPREDVLGTRQDSYLLSLDDRAVAHRDALIAMAKHLASACVVGNPAPLVKRMGARIGDPQPGDLVVEVSAMRSRDPDARVKGFGILLEHRREWWHTDEEWAALLAEDPSGGGERPTDDAWYVQYGPEPTDVCRWTNCEFVVIPTDPRQFDLTIGTRDERGVTLTRADLVSSLADSGFALRGSSGSDREVQP